MGGNKTILSLTFQNYFFQIVWYSCLWPTTIANFLFSKLLLDPGTWWFYCGACLLTQVSHHTLSYPLHILPAGPLPIKQRCPQCTARATPAATAAREPAGSPRAGATQPSSLQTVNFSAFKRFAVTSGSTVTRTRTEVTHQRYREMRCVLQVAKEVIIGWENQFSQSFPLD